jgi:anaerobic selenocysteine-containing dehydrogenase
MARLAGEAMRAELRTPLAGLAGYAPLLAELADFSDFPEEGVRLVSKNPSADGFHSNLEPPEAADSNEFAIILTERTFGTEELSSYSACLKLLEEEPFAGLHRQDAETLGIRAGDRLAIRTPSGMIELAAKVFDCMAPGVILIPRLRSLPWQAFGKRIRRQDIRKA